MVVQTLKSLNSDQSQPENVRSFKLVQPQTDPKLRKHYESCSFQKCAS